MRTKSSAGFTLLELLIVVAIILIIATIAVPSFLRSRQLANENSAVANLRTLSNAQATYSGSSGGLYTDLTELVRGGLVDSRFNGPVGGYSLSIAATGYEFTATATPVNTNSGRYGFYMATDGVIRYSMAASMAPTGQTGNPVVQ